MAGDWIKVREDIHEDPAVLKMAARLGTRPEHIVGYCVRFWAWVSRNCHAGSVTGVTLASLESVINLPGFCALLQEVGWLKYTETDNDPRIVIPKFDRHLSQSSKKRALAAERQKNSRDKKVSRTERDKSVTREEKRREEYKNKNPLTPLKGGSRRSTRKERANQAAREMAIEYLDSTVNPSGLDIDLLKEIESASGWRNLSEERIEVLLEHVAIKKGFKNAG